MGQKNISLPILSDQPTNVDRLDFAPYTETIKDIIESTTVDTPLTIGIFGTWGSGKTSLLRMVQAQLNKNITTIWFDAWKYDKEEVLWRAFLVSVISSIKLSIESRNDLTEEEKLLAYEELNDLGSSLYRSIEREELGKIQINWQELIKGSIESAIHVGLSLIPGLKLAQAVIEEVGGSAIKNDPGLILKAIEREKNEIFIDHIRSLEQFQNKFEHIVSDYIQKRLVVFIDDLDRCVPEKAIEVLEAIKLFLDVDGCIFVLGVDQEVISRGVELKYRETRSNYEDHDKAAYIIDGNKYLEKIIQLPFQIPPIEREDLDDFINSLISDWPDNLCPDVFSEGLDDNPRQIKRAINVFLLLWKLAQKRENKLGDQIKPVRLAKIVVIQNVYRELYEVLKNTPRLLVELEKFYRYEEKHEIDSDIVNEEQEKREYPLPQILLPYIGSYSIRRILTMHSEEILNVNFYDLSPNEIKLYFTLTQRTEIQKIDTEAVIFEPEMVEIPAGRFLMGSTKEEIDKVVSEGLKREYAVRELPKHEVSLPKFLIGKYLITNSEYSLFISSTGYRAPRNWEKGQPPTSKGDHPVTYVSWYDANEYCEWLTQRTGKLFRLPTEEEWEKAARYYDGRIYPWGDEWNTDYCNSKESRFDNTTPVGQYSPRGDSSFGCGDMAGNVYEWCNSTIASYPTHNRLLDSADNQPRIYRGGSYLHSRLYSRCAFRGIRAPGDRQSLIGFRCCHVPSE